MFFILENVSKSNSTIGRRVVRVLNLHRDKKTHKAEGENRGEMGGSFVIVTTGRMAKLQMVGLVT